MTTLYKCDNCGKMHTEESQTIVVTEYGFSRDHYCSLHCLKERRV